MKQVSAFPDEVPDKEIKIRHNKRSVRGGLCALIKKEGFYNFAKAYQEVMTRPDEYFDKFYQLDRETVLGMFRAVFGDSTGHTITMEQFLKEIKNKPAYRLPAYCEKLRQEVR